MNEIWRKRTTFATLQPQLDALQDDARSSFSPLDAILVRRYMSLRIDEFTQVTSLTLKKQLLDLGINGGAKQLTQIKLFSITAPFKFRLE